MPVRIIVDQRETRNPTVKILEKLGADLVFKTLETGDFVVSEKCAFEFKTPADFLESVVGNEKGKIFRQVSDLVKAYEKPALLISGDLPDLFVRNIHTNAIFAMLQTIMWMGAPVRFLGTADTAAQYIFETAKTEQEGGRHDFCEHGGKTKRTASESMEYIVSAIPDVGAILARALLLKFGSVEAVITAPAEELAEVEGIGMKTAESIRRIVGETYFGGR